MRQYCSASDLIISSLESDFLAGKHPHILTIDKNSTVSMRIDVSP